MDMQLWFIFFRIAKYLLSWLRASGLMIVTSCVVAVPMMIMSDKLLQKVGRTTIFAGAFFIYGVRNLGYAYVT